MEENKIPEEIVDTEIQEAVEETALELEAEDALAEAIEETPAPKKKPSWLWIGVAGAILVVMAVTVLLALLGNKVDYSKFVNLGQYVGLTVPVEEVSVTDAEVDKAIEAKLEAAITFEEVDRAAEKGDTVNIDYVGKYAADGSEFSGGSAKGADLELGSGSFIPGFEDGLIGTVKGQTIDLNLTFPENYQNTLLAGAEVIFTVTVNAVKEPVTPELNEAFVEKNSEVKTVEEYRKLIYDQLLADKQAQADAKREDTAWNQIIENAEILDYPESELTKQLESVRYDLSSYYGMEYDELVTSYTAYAGISVEEFEEMVMQQAKYELEYKMITYSIAKAEDITWTQEEYDEQVNQFLASSGSLSLESFESTYKIDFEKTYRQRIIDSIVHNKVTDFILANAVTE
ncbi:MAG: trigger factor [Clostridia bacterium]|nr:trigger factor [Clostridia bacterium]